VGGNVLRNRIINFWPNFSRKLLFTSWIRSADRNADHLSQTLWTSTEKDTSCECGLVLYLCYG